VELGTQLISNENDDRIDWAAQCRLALRVSLLAMLAAALLYPFVAETTIIVSVIVAGTIASWWHLETAAPQRSELRARRR
jgi:hypothetical protein